MTEISDRAAIAGIGASRFGRHLPESQLALGAAAFRAALAYRRYRGRHQRGPRAKTISMGSP